MDIIYIVLIASITVSIIIIMINIYSTSNIKNKFTTTEPTNFINLNGNIYNKKFSNILKW